MIIYYGTAPKTKAGGPAANGSIQPDYINMHYGTGQLVVAVCVKKSVYPLGEIATLEPGEVYGIIAGTKFVAVMQYSETDEEHNVPVPPENRLVD